MKAAIYAILLVVGVFAGCSSCQKLTQCRERCTTKIPDIQLCNQTCDQLLNSLVNSSSASNLTSLPPVPDSPLLLSSTYFTFALQWDDYSRTKCNASPVVYVLETTRHKNSSDPAIILPAIKKYHMTNATTFKIPEQLVTKTNFSFRLAVVTVQGTSDFSPPSPLYMTNDTCVRSKHLLPPGGFNPCPTFNVRINFTATEVLFQEPRISAVLFWDYPHDILNLESQLTLDVVLSRRIPYTRKQECVRFGTSFKSELITPHSGSTSEIYHLPPEDQLYFGCPYDIKLSSTYEFKYFKTEATFYVPHCIHGFCGCDDGNTDTKRESEYIDIDIRQSNHSENITTANVTWRNEAWGTKVPEYFRLSILECPNGNCPHPIGQKKDILLADRMKTSHSYVLQNLTEGEEHWIIIEAHDKSGCLLTPKEGQIFKAIVPLPPTPAPVTTEPRTEHRTVKPSTLVSSPPPTTPSTGQTTAVETAKKGLSPATVAAITVPIVLLLLVGLALVFLCYFRLHRKPHRLHRAPTGLQRLADHMRDNDRDGYQRNRQHDLSSPYSSDYDRAEQVVNLPLKSEGGLELNPAYVEQRIQEAVETGEADEFEFGYHRLELKRLLGKGAFGKVFLAEAYGIGGSEETGLVAVKVLNEKANEDEKEDFKMEINFMKTIGRHENVVIMLGCCTLYPPLCLIVEYVPHGDLLHYLRNLRKTFEMQNRKLQEDEIEKLKKNAKSNSTSSEAQITGAESAMGQGSYSRRPLVPSVSDTALSVLSLDAEQIPAKAKKRRLLRQCKSEGKQLSIHNAFKKYEKFFEADKLAKLKRTNSASSFMTLSSINLFSPRRASETPRVHYLSRVPTDVSNTTETTLVTDTKSAANAPPSSPSRTMGLDGALDSSDLQSFALQIANGMTYLAGNGIIHRDLAARNILVGDEKVLKISDFGLSREGIYVKRSTGKIPLRWLSIEAMRERIYSTASDIWAFGIVLWEICTLGGFPYPTSNDRDLLDFLLDGNRMDKPDNCTDEIYQIMLACWSRDCEDRPSFQSLSEQLFDMQKEEHPYVNVDPSQDFILPPTAGQDTVGNLIAFSDGTFSGATADQELELPTAVTLPKNLIPVSSDVENAGYESSNASSKEDLSISGAEAAENDIIQFSPPGGHTNDIEDLNDESPV